MTPPDRAGAKSQGGHAGGADEPSTLFLFGACWLAVAALVLPNGSQPPVWDTTMGLFPAAQVLSENGFSLQDLLTRPGFEGGGPNVHPFSWVTWGTALVLAATEGELAFRVLHVAHAAMGAGVCVAVFRLAAPVLGALGSSMLVGVILLFPLFQVQLGALYAEVPLALATSWAVVMFASRRFFAAILWGALACATKETGVIVPVALGVAAVLEKAPMWTRAKRAVAWISIPLFAVLLQLAYVVPARSGQGAARLGWWVQIQDALGKLAMLPDWALLLTLFVGVSLAALPRFLRALSQESESIDRSLAVGALVVGAFLGFFATLPLVVIEEYLLPRYYIQIVPLVFVGLACALASRVPRPVAAGLAVLLALGFILNRDGEFLGLYPPVRGNEFSLAERSHEARDLLAVQQDLIAAAKALPKSLPVYYGLPEHYLFEYSRSGYADAPLPNGRCVWLDEVGRRARLSEFPSHFAVLVNFIGYGGAQFRSLVRQANLDPRWTLTPERFERGSYETALVIFRHH